MDDGIRVVNIIIVFFEKESTLMVDLKDWWQLNDGFPLRTTP